MNTYLPVIIIPAYNERTVIGRTLTPLYKGVENNEFQIIVAVNGSDDDSVEYIQSMFPKVRCLDITLGSKTNAINEVEYNLDGFPRIYMDADVVISYEGMQSLIAKLLETDQPLLVAPKANMNFDQANFLVIAFYRAWFKTRFYTDQGFGGGAYGLNKAARQRFSIFPKIIADDGFIREVVPKEQQIVVTTCTSLVQAPATLRDLIKIKTRSKLGNIELKKKGMINNIEMKGKRFIQKTTILEFIVYALVNFLAKYSAKKKQNTLEDYTWQKDESSRKEI